MPRLIFINVAVRDLPASRKFFGELGFAFNEKFCDETAACMVIEDNASYAMLIERERFADFAGKPVADATATTEALLCLTADSREDVDAFADKALSAGASPAKEPTDYGFMYGRSFYDPDGHHWEIMWMDPRAVEQGPAEFAQTA